MIRKIEINELPRLFELARKFYASAPSLGNFDPDTAVRGWAYFLQNGMGAIFVIEDDGDIHGMIAALKTPDIHSGEMKAVEMAWFVDEKHRGRGLLLLKEFEKWAKDNGCKKVCMMYLSDLMPEKLKAVYTRLGYKEVELSYLKEV